MLLENLDVPIDSVKNLNLVKVIPYVAKIYLISDTHFGHRNIIQYCHRPFGSTDEMNRAMIGNWNSTVGDNDLVYFVGDLGLTRRHPTKYWLDQLMGHIVFIKGNHDDHSVSSLPNVAFDYGGKRFFVSHYPNSVPKSWAGWVIHGHKHNNDIENFPFINGVKKTINVSVELIGYKPLNIDEVVDNLDSTRRQDTIDSIAKTF